MDHNDRLVFGSTHIWVFQNPKEKGIAKKQYPPITYEYAQEEIAAKGISFKRNFSINISNCKPLLKCDLIPEIKTFDFQLESTLKTRVRRM